NQRAIFGLSLVLPLTTYWVLPGPWAWNRLGLRLRLSLDGPHCIRHHHVVPDSDTKKSRHLLSYSNALLVASIFNLPGFFAH
ncbi:hypothetical protein B0H14DRAFT_2794169, partial [Mycena olivaceomarginata]